MFPKAGTDVHVSCALNEHRAELFCSPQQLVFSLTVNPQTPSPEGTSDPEPCPLSRLLPLGPAPSPVNPASGSSALSSTEEPLGP